MRIPDPTEIINSRIERNIGDTDGDKCMCRGCGEMFDIDDMVTVSPSPDAPLACWECSGLADLPEEELERAFGAKAYSDSLEI